jgi:uncharacterized delta-60 repeat protein
MYSSRANIIPTISIMLSLTCSQHAWGEGPFDPTFDGAGFSIYWAGDHPGDAQGLTQDTQGRLIVAATSERNLAVTRHLANGELDTTFADRGLASNFFYLGPDDGAWARSVALDHHDRIVVGGGITGTMTCGSVEKHVRTFVTVRLINASGDDDGAADPNFNSLGFSAYLDCASDDNLIYDMAVANDDSIYAIGKAVNASPSKALITKWKPDGQMDGTFGTNGVISYAPGAVDNFGTGIVVDDKGRVLATAMSSDGSAYSLRLIRLTSDGQLDPTFGTGGTVDIANAAPNPHLNFFNLCCVKIDRLGRILVAGLEYPHIYPDVGNSTAFVARFSEFGRPDETFGDHGYAFFGEDDFQGVGPLVVDARNRVVLGGDVKSPYAAIRAPASVQLNIDGSLNHAVGFDASFSAEFGYNTYLNAILSSDDGRILMAATDFSSSSALIAFDQIFGDGFD